jgi:hypothetical protein
MLVVGYKRTRNLEGSWVQKADVLDGGKIVCSVEWRKDPETAVKMTTHCMNGGHAEEIDLCRIAQQVA